MDSDIEHYCLLVILSLIPKIRIFSWKTLYLSRAKPTDWVFFLGISEFFSHQQQKFSFFWLNTMFSLGDLTISVLCIELGWNLEKNFPNKLPHWFRISREKTILKQGGKIRMSETTIHNFFDKGEKSSHNLEFWRGLRKVHEWTTIFRIKIKPK